MYVASPFISHSQPTKLMQPTQRAFDNPSIYSQAAAMGSAPLCQHWRDVEASQLLGEVAQSHILGLRAVHRVVVVAAPVCLSPQVSPPPEGEPG